jgi:malonyl-CoA O-methyltransferase
MAQIQCPSLNIFGESDGLVPVAAAANIEHSHIISGAGHLPHLTAADQLIDVLDNFFERQSYRLDKQKVAESFGRAAQRYDAVAQLQHRMGEQLLNSISNHQAPANILDLGCGTGYHSVQLQRRFPQSQVTGVDISPGMLAYAQTQYPDCTWLCSDAEQMDLATGSQQLIFSNFALQWCDDLARLAAELHRVLAAEGQLYLVVPGPQTLLELREAWAQVDEGIHVNRFSSLHEWQAALTDAGFDKVKLESNLVTEQHQSVRELLLELKNVGAHNNNAGKANHLTGKQQLKALYNAYDKFRLPDGTIPATWEIISGVITKSSLPNL